MSTHWISNCFQTWSKPLDSLDLFGFRDCFGHFWIFFVLESVSNFARFARSKYFAFEGKLELKLKCLKILWKVCSLGNKSVVGCCCHLCFCTWLAQWYTSLSDWICNCARSMWMMKMVEALRTSFSSAAISSQASHPKTQFWAFLSERSEITRTLSLKYEKGPKLSKKV